MERLPFGRQDGTEFAEELLLGRAYKTRSHEDRFQPRHGAGAAAGKKAEDQKMRSKGSHRPELTKKREKA